MGDKDVFVNQDSVSIYLPSAVIRDVIINPSDIETFYESGRWSNEEMTILKMSARAKLLQEAANLGLIQNANLKARSVIEQFLKAAQFKKIVVKMRE